MFLPAQPLGKLRAGVLDALTEFLEFLLDLLPVVLELLKDFGQNF